MLGQGFTLSERRRTDSLNIPKVNPPASPWSTLYREVVGVGVVSALPGAKYCCIHFTCVSTVTHCQYTHSINENTEVHRDRIKAKTKPQPQDDTASREAKIEGGAIYPTAREEYFLCPSTRVLLRCCCQPSRPIPREEQNWPGHPQLGSGEGNKAF